MNTRKKHRKKSTGATSSKKIDNPEVGAGGFEMVRETGVNDIHQAVIDAYFINGFNATQAMLTVNPKLQYHSAGAMANAILNNKQNKAYLEEKRSRLRASTDIRNENILRELINWAYCDITKFITLSEDEIKELPEDIKRCIQSYKIYEKTSVDRNGTKHHTKTIEIKAVNKLAALESISKHVGFFSLDNEQKRTKINLEKVDVNILNGLLQAIEIEQLE